ncbi:DUF1292 domain-containing protein [Salipaludibacillus neizhouensis]|uniref:DUF1292 domain-containing protein n=1 Tax=Salipaludibacillus neizhouensis TaxID=885475 RepID=A0A3A9KKK3_9BACI|nr:DUF1292 domain-containing protein [Salipaludibacillus neizhouensis]RKL65416.1 DUF1292 domain-containing protein [Salipaludibacillus neizhouensis]
MEKLEIGNVFTISDENTEDQEVEVLGTMELDDNEYVAVSFVDELEQESEEVDVFFLKVDNNGAISAIDSDEEFEKVSSGFDEQMDQFE